MYMQDFMHSWSLSCTIHIRVFDMFEAWAKLAQQWLVCVLLGRLTAPSGPKRELCSAK